MDALALLAFGHHGGHGRNVFGRARLASTLAFPDLTAAVKVQHLSHSTHQRLLREVRFGGGIFAAAITGVDVIAGAHEERHPGEVALELKEVDVHPVHGLHADANKLPGSLGDFVIATDNLSVEAGAGYSAFAAKN